MDQKLNADDEINIDALMQVAEAIKDNPDAYLPAEEAIEVLA